MKLKSVSSVMKPLKKGWYTLHPKDEDFSLKVQETEGFYQLVKDKSSKRWFLIEMDGKLVIMSEFEINDDGGPNWLTMCVIPYSEIMQNTDLMLPVSTTIIERYF